MDLDEVPLPASSVTVPLISLFSTHVPYEAPLPANQQTPVYFGGGARSLWGAVVGGSAASCLATFGMVLDGPFTAIQKKN